MSEQACAAMCGQPTTGAMLCDHCEKTLTQHLAELPALAEHLRITITRQAILTNRNGSRSAETSIPWHDKAANARTALLNDLWRWTLALREPAEPLPRGGIDHLGRWLYTRINLILTWNQAGELAITLERHTNRCWHIMDRPADRIFAGICSHPTPRGLCETWLYAQPGKPTVTCPTCGTHHDVAQRRETLRQAAEDVLATAAEIARAVTWLGDHIRADRIRQWAARGRLTKRADDDGHPLYRIGDVLDLLAQVEEKAAS